MKGLLIQLGLVWVALLILLAATVIAAHLPLGAAKPWISYAIAFAKAALILWVFMEMRKEGAIARLAMMAAMVWLIMMMTLSASDYLTRGWLSG
ncbi:cytochrome C oxidase subunit IV family protein [Sphingobium estronivorans]|uniref:cytochrome C oxidase subunit IV family protein n=1 Tax=Sphingobium estronivorans TaxID=1577690 RepID=UPI0013C32E72|nr:cytochrome C oxidase subunit IV family protein [Sphingobium estronivorans]